MAKFFISTFLTRTLNFSIDDSGKHKKLTSTLEYQISRFMIVRNLQKTTFLTRFFVELTKVPFPDKLYTGH